jgi:hypothetical protein
VFLEDADDIDLNADLVGALKDADGTFTKRFFFDDKDALDDTDAGKEEAVDVQRGERRCGGNS